MDRARLTQGLSEATITKVELLRELFEQGASVSQAAFDRKVNLTAFEAIEIIHELHVRKLLPNLRSREPPEPKQHLPPPYPLEEPNEPTFTFKEPPMAKPAPQAYNVVHDHQAHFDCTWYTMLGREAYRQLINHQAGSAAPGEIVVQLMHGTHGGSFRVTAQICGKVDECVAVFDVDAIHVLLMQWHNKNLSIHPRFTTLEIPYTPEAFACVIKEELCDKLNLRRDEVTVALSVGPDHSYQV